MKKLGLFLTCIVVILSGCSNKEISEKFIPKAESQYAKDYLERIRVQDFDYVKNHLHPDVLKQATDEKLLEVVNYFPKGELISTEFIGSHIYVVNEIWYGNFFI